MRQLCVYNVVAATSASWVLQWH